MIKVLVTGAFSTGKTTLVEGLTLALRAASVEVAVVTDTARICPLDLNSDQTDSSSLWLLSMQVAREIAGAAAGPEMLLCDRGVPDILAHHLEVETIHGRGRIALLDGFLADWIRSYDLILFSRVDTSVPIQPDGTRVNDISYRDLLDRYAVQVLESVVGVFELPSDPAGRLDYALALIAASFARSAPPSTSII